MYNVSAISIETYEAYTELTETLVTCTMAAEGVTVLKRCYIGLAVFTVALIASTGLYLHDSWKYEFHLTSFLSVQQEETARPKKANQSRASRFVSVCSSDLDGRRLGNHAAVQLGSGVIGLRGTPNRFMSV